MGAEGGLKAGKWGWKDGAITIAGELKGQQ